MLLKTTGLTKTYTTSGHLITALDAVDLSFSENSFTCVCWQVWNLPLPER